jgi:hypothetical protein
MRAQTSQESRILEVSTRFKVQHVELLVTCIKRLRAHLRDMTRASKIASCNRGFTHKDEWEAIPNRRMILNDKICEVMKYRGVEGVVRGLEGIHLADSSILTKLE